MYTENPPDPEKVCELYAMKEKLTVCREVFYTDRCKLTERYYIEYIYIKIMYLGTFQNVFVKNS